MATVTITPMTNSVAFADITTIGVGGRIARFVEPDTRVGIIEAVEDADSKGLPLLVIGGGSNLLVSDDDFPGVVVRDARRTITVPDEAAPVEGEAHIVHVNAEAGCNWDDFVAFCVELGLEGVEGLSGIPGTVGASVVQNIGAYGQEVSTSVSSVEVWDRQTKTTQELDRKDLKFGYRTSLLKQSMYVQPAVPDTQYFPTPRYVVLSVTFTMQYSETGTVGYGQLAHALGVQVGDRMSTRAIRSAVLRVRASKGMLEDATRYRSAWMQGTRKQSNLDIALRAQGGDMPDYNRHSCGSFFMNPIVTERQAEALPEDAPRFAAVLPDGSAGVKTSAAWLIDHAGFHKGFALDGYVQGPAESEGEMQGASHEGEDSSERTVQSSASLSTLHTLALTNRGTAKAIDIQSLAQSIQDGVEQAFGIRLVPEPVVVGLHLA
nr:UDP-N-acetylmuramate dehydrogenase [Bifidobacterium tsurumiense]